MTVFIALPHSERGPGDLDSNLDRDSFDEFFRRSFPRVTAFLIKQGVRKEDAKDAAQEAMKEAYLSWGSIEYPDAWAHQVALRQAAKQEKRRRDGVAKATRDAAEVGWCAAVLPQDDSVMFKEEQRLVLAALQLLPELQRRVLALDLDGYKTAEIAVLLDMKPQTVRSHRRHARERLRREFPHPLGIDERSGRSRS